jgi:cell division cycle protein 20 (cofactor of APC complex)
LACKQKAPKPTTGFQNDLRVLFTQNKGAPQVCARLSLSTLGPPLPPFALKLTLQYIPEPRTNAGFLPFLQVKRAARHISNTPERILDAPDLIDDYYLNLMDWSSGNLMAVALGPAVYMWDPASGGIDLLYEAPEAEYVSSVQFMGDGTHIALGMSSNEVLLWDVARKKQVRSMKGHSARVSSLAWNNHVLSSGSRDSSIMNHDVRIAQHHIQTWSGHQQEVCGLKWSPDGTQLASGGNDNLCCIWDVAAQTDPRHILTESTAAVKALAWSPHERNLLALGSGTADRHIRFMDTLSGSVVNKIDTGSQVCSLIWNPHEKEILSSHGFSENQLCIWKYPTMVKTAELFGHQSRVLHTALSTDGTTVCSAAADETLRFWKVFDGPQKKDKRPRVEKHASKLTMSIR